MSNQIDSSDTRFLRGDPQFQQMPAKIRLWVLESPNAATEFATFFRRGGFIYKEENIKLPYFRETIPPRIVVNGSEWEVLRQKDAPEWPQRELFGTLAHEIGHDRFNTGNAPFTGTTAEEYVQYRSALEASAIFNAFPIFKDLENTPEFKGPPFGAIGYLNSVELGALYGQWRHGEMGDQAVIDLMTSKVPDARYKLSRPVQDMNRDGVLTHRDNYLQDFEQYVKPRLALQSSIGHSTDLDDPSRTDHRIAPPYQTRAPAPEYRFFPRTPEDDYVDAYLGAMDRGDYAARLYLTEQYEQLPHVHALQQEAREAMLAEQQRLLEEQIRQEQERQYLAQQKQQEHSRGRGISL